MKLLFLDVDGVLINQDDLIHNQGRPGIERVALLNKLLEVTGAWIVVSSCHRLGRNRIQLCDLFNDWGVMPGRILDRTAQGGIGNVPRGVEIKEWLDRRGKRCGVEGFVIIDDGSDMDELMPHLVKTEFETGITEETVRLATHKLALQPDSEEEAA